MLVPIQFISIAPDPLHFRWIRTGSVPDRKTCIASRILDNFSNTQKYIELIR